jgi:hypothetical protein
MSMIMSGMTPFERQIFINRIIMVGMRKLDDLRHKVELGYRAIHKKHFIDMRYGNHKWWPRQTKLNRKQQLLEGDSGQLIQALTNGMSLVVSGNRVQFIFKPDPGMKWVHDSLTPTKLTTRSGKAFAIPQIREVYRIWPSKYMGRIKKRGNMLRIWRGGRWKNAWKLKKSVLMPGRKFSGMSELDIPIMQQYIQEWCISVMNTAYNEMQAHGVPRHMRRGIYG